MTGALVILAALVLIGALLFVTDVTYFRHHHATGNNTSSEGNQTGEISDVAPDTAPHGEFCCGQHLVCEKTGLSPIGDEIIYYDDEELDRFAGREAGSYTPAETEEFRDVLLTLLPEDVAGWARSITLRKIELPTDVREELLMIVSELRG